MKPKIHIVPSVAFGQAPELWVGNDKYKFDPVSALYWLRVLTDYIYNTVHRQMGPTDAPHPIETEEAEAAQTVPKAR